MLDRLRTVVTTDVVRGINTHQLVFIRLNLANVRLEKRKEQTRFFILCEAKFSIWAWSDWQICKICGLVETPCFQTCLYLTEHRVIIFEIIAICYEAKSNLEIVFLCFHLIFLIKVVLLEACHHIRIIVKPHYIVFVQSINAHNSEESDS